jgi:hypothetical protein
MTNLLKILLVAIATLALVSSHEMGEVDITSAKFVDYETSRDIENVPGFELIDVTEKRTERGLLRSTFNATAAHLKTVEASYPSFSRQGGCTAYPGSCAVYCSGNREWYYLRDVRRSCIVHSRHDLIHMIYTCASES